MTSFRTQFIVPAVKMVYSSFDQHGDVILGMAALHGGRMMARRIPVLGRGCHGKFDPSILFSSAPPFYGEIPCLRRLVWVFCSVLGFVEAFNSCICGQAESYVHKSCKAFRLRP